MFQKILVELPKSPSAKEKHQSLLYFIGGGWYVKKFNWEAYTPKEEENEKKSTRKGGRNKKKYANG